MVLQQVEPKKIYIRVPAPLISTAWIYHDEVNGLISLSSNGSTWITIADKNLWATSVYNWTNDEAHCWKFYQWWNNYGFPYSWAITTSYSQINVSTYWPWNYYSSSTFITQSSGDWANPRNNNLWWYFTGTNVAMQWPCDSGFHIPTSTELTNFFNTWVSLWAWSASNWTGIVTYAKIWMWGWLASNSWSIGNVGSQAYIWSSQYYGSNTINAYWIYIASTQVAIRNNISKSNWCSIRPFKNTPTQPDETWTILYQPS